jgi:hypothetical protein
MRRMDWPLLIILSVILLPLGIIIVNYIRSGHGPPGGGS